MRRTHLAVWLLVAIVLLLMVGIFRAIAAATDAKTITWPLRFVVGATTARFANGDSADVVVAYPSDEDTAGKRNELTWVGGTLSAWSFTPDSTEVYDFYCNDTLLSVPSGKLYWANDVPEGYVATSRAFAAGVVESLAIASGAVRSVHIEDGSVSSAKIASEAVTPDLLASGDKFFSVSGLDSTELAYAEILEIMAYTGGSGVMRGSWTFDQSGTAVIFSGPQVEFADSVSFEGPVRLGTNGTDLLTVEANTYMKGDLLFGSATSDSATFRGPVHFDDVQLFTSVTCDSFAASTTTKWVEVAGVSDLMTDGYMVACRAWWNYTPYQMDNIPVAGDTYKQTLYAAPIRQYTAMPTWPASDSVYVKYPTANIALMPFCVECFGRK